jgi:hypothetical protein
MSFPASLNPRTSPPTRRRPIRRRPPTSRLVLESLEDRCLLSFSPAVTYPVGVEPWAVVTGDFNGDGRPDLAVANSASNSVSILRGNANGTFLAAQHFATGGRPVSLAVGDFNGDGKLDLVTADADWSAVSVLLGNGNGTLQAATNFVVNSGVTPTSVAVGDFNGDGKLDLAVGSNITVQYAGDFIVGDVLLGHGDGSFGAPISVFADGIGINGGVSVTAADFNGDGKSDFAMASPVGYGAVYLSRGDGTFEPPSYFSLSSGSFPQPSIAAGDVNGDGKLDLVTANSGGDTVSVLLGTGTGSFGTARNSYAGSGPSSVAMADFNGDGKLDLVTSAGVLLGDGTGSFKGPVSGRVAVGVAVGDFDGDGRRDVASAEPWSNNVSVQLNDGTWPATDLPSISVNDVTVTEGNSGMTAATFTVSLSAAYGQPVSVLYATADNSAHAGSDYQAASGTLSFAPGVTSRTITVLVNGDRVSESTETFVLRLTSPTNAFLADPSGVGTILDDEPFVDISGSSGLEGNSGTTPFTFTVTLSAAYDVPVTVNYETSDLTDDEIYWNGLTAATAGVDYTAKSGTVTIAPGQTRATITVLVNGDRVGESDETFAVYLTGTTFGVIHYSEAYGTIVNDDPLVSISGGGTVTEGNTGTKSVTFTVTLSAASDATVTATYATADGTATIAGGDYRAASGTLTFAPGQTSKTITVLINGDRLPEADEYFYVNLTGVTNAGIANDSAFAMIRDDEPRISIGDVSKAEGKKGQTTLFTFTVTLSAAYDQAVTMSFRTANGTATAGDDYIARTGTLTFNPGETSKTITIEVWGDNKREANETFYLDLSGNSVNSLFAKKRGIGTILNDD